MNRAGTSWMCYVGPDSLGVALEHVDRVDGRVSEVPQTEGGVSGRGDHQALGGVSTAVGQLLVVTWTHTQHIYTRMQHLYNPLDYVCVCVCVRRARN